MNSHIKVRGAKEHNLKNIDVDIPKNKLTVITGISGSGKSSLAFDTIYAEGQRRYMESFSAYARQFIGDLERPKVDEISGLSPVISIEQKTTNRNPRSTVGTITEIYDFFRLLYARVAIPYSYITGKEMIQYSEEEIVLEIKKRYKKKKIAVLAPLVKGRKGHYRELFESLRKQAFTKVRVDGEIKELSDKLSLDRYKNHDIEVVIDRLLVEEKNAYRLNDSVQLALRLGKQSLYVLDLDENKNQLFSKQLMCADSGISYEEPSPNTFSFNTPYGYCPQCLGIGTLAQIDIESIIPDKKISIQDGAIIPLGKKKDSYFFRLIDEVAKQKKIKLNIAINKLKEEELNLILYGKSSPTLSAKDKDVQFEGIIPLVQRWYEDSSSTNIQRWAGEFMQIAACETCAGARLKKEALYFRIDNKNIDEISHWDLQTLKNWVEGLDKKLNTKQKTIAKEVLKEIQERLSFILNVGLDYLNLARNTGTLSGGESQRIRLATQVGSKLKGITYILDEPSIGLHQRDNQRLIGALKDLRDTGNTVIVVEHDKDIMLQADYLLDIGPGAGKFGGKVVGEGEPKHFFKQDSSTSKFVKGIEKIEIPKVRRKGIGKFIELKGAQGNNLKKVKVKFPLGCFIGIAGVSGSGKSSLINETLYPLLAKEVYKSKYPILPFREIIGLDNIDKVVEIDQSPIGRSPRSNPATYCGFYTDIRTLFAEIPESKIRGYKAGRFSFNVKGGRCETCEGAGVKMIEMNFLPTVQVPCDTCFSKRFNKETLEIKYRGKSISDILEMTVDEAVAFFEPLHYIHRKIKALQDVGLGYISLGQSAITLSGGEAQRVKLSSELSKRDTGSTIYILDEPTTGLHFQDIKLLLKVLDTLVEKGNTVLVIEHNMDVLKVADYIIELGPEGGERGGYIIAEGSPEKISRDKKSITGQFLKQELN